MSLFYIKQLVKPASRPEKPLRRRNRRHHDASLAFLLRNRNSDASRLRRPHDRDGRRKHGLDGLQVLQPDVQAAARR